MFATSVLYPIEIVDGRLGVIMALNPMTHIINAYRSVILGMPMADVNAFTITAVGSAVLLAGAWLLFHRSEYEFAERV
jgi:ABC-type polysaccharide/polyol phosphate export permease